MSEDLLDLGEFLGRTYWVYERSVRKADGTTFALVRGPGGKRLFVSRALPGFSGEQLASGGLLCPLTYANARRLAQIFLWLSPKRLPSDVPSFGFGDRIGLATPGHIQALAEAKVFPILAQQSVRENSRTGRSFQDVLATAMFGAFQEGYERGFGADADHLKRIEDALEAAELGYTFFTCDPSDHVVAAERLSSEELGRRFPALPAADVLRREYLGKDFLIAGLGRLRFSEPDLVRAAVKYGKAVAFAAEMYAAIPAKLPAGFDYEVSVDEAETPTTPAEHFFIAHELGRLGVKLASLAPRFPGQMEKAVDYRGSLEVFRRDLRAHVAIARHLGGYRISLHSGSDKFLLYPVFAQEGAEIWHVKTAGTSYLVALEVVAKAAPALFREIAKLSLERFSEDRASYQLSTDLARIPPIEKISDAELPELLVQEDSRQVLHVAFGSVLQGKLGEELKRVLAEHEEAHYEALARHLGQHLGALGVKSDSVS